MNYPQNKAVVYLTPPLIQSCGNSQHLQECRQRRKLKIEYETSSIETMRFTRMVKKPSRRVRNSGVTVFTRIASTLQDADSSQLPFNLPKVLSSRSLSPEPTLKLVTSPERVCIHPSNDASTRVFSAVHGHSAHPNRPRIGQARLMVKKK